jgi:hypothetical protein
VHLKSLVTYIDGIDLPESMFVELRRVFISTISESIYLISNIDENSIFHLFPYITLRNAFDLESGQVYYGEVKLNMLRMDRNQIKLIAVCHCRIGS